MKEALLAAVFLSIISVQAYGCLPPSPIRDLQVTELTVYNAECNSVATLSVTLTNKGERREKSTLRFFVDGREIWPCTRVVTIESGGSISTECKWQTVTGVHTIVARIDELIGEKDTTDNKKSQEVNVFCCSEGFLEEYRCLWNWRQQKYRHADCSVEWKKVEYCSEGCYNGSCIAKCREGYTDEYVCSGNWRQRKYIYSNCSVTFINYEYCKHGCFRNYCLPPPISYCGVDVDVKVPSNAFVHDTLEAKVITANLIGTPTSIKLYVYLCSDFCWYMPCSSTLYLEPKTKFTLTCTSLLQRAGNYQVIVQYEACGRNYTESSPVFPVSNVRPSIYFLPAQPLKAEPVLLLKSYYTAGKCTNTTIQFDVMNAGSRDSTFYLSVEGEASSWISLAPSVSLKGKEKRTISANVTVPCYITEGNYEFSIRAKNSREAYAKSFLSTPREPQPIFLPEEKIILIAILILILLVLAYKRPNVRKKPETFEGDC